MRQGVPTVVGSKDGHGLSLWQGHSSMSNGTTLLPTWGVTALLLVPTSSHPSLTHSKSCAHCLKCARGVCVWGDSMCHNRQVGAQGPSRDRRCPSCV